jgi:hypothetical protein
VRCAEQGLGELLRRVGKMLVEQVMDAEAGQIVGERSKPAARSSSLRWGTELGYCIIDGQKVPVQRPRVRSKVHNREIPLGSYELFQRAPLNRGERLAQDTARPHYSKLQGGGAAVQPSVWVGKEHRQRAFCRSKPQEAARWNDMLAGQPFHLRDD